MVVTATVPPDFVRLLPFASFNWTVMTLALVPSAVMDDALATTVDIDSDAAPGTVTMLALVPASDVLSVAVTVYVMPEVVDVVKLTVAVPFAVVVEVVDANVPPLPVLLHVTVFPLVATELPLASAS